MKKSILVLALMVATGSAYATDRGNQGATALAGSVAVAGAIAGASANGGGATANGGNISFDSQRPLPNAPGLSSASSNSSGKHRILQQRQGSFLLGGWTNIDMVLDLPAFVGSNPTADEQLAACVQDAGFRKFRQLKGNPCPQ